ncbi:MAG: carboxypeptidase regulatory-like domain-containing protein, partial [Alistipes sp.]|nr:carboxypeptidase regulatory-like domain-containing protein [Alistipes sp.]
MKYLFLQVLLLLAVVSGTYAQVTTSSVGGRITDHESNPLIGVSVTAVHQPSGTRYGVATDLSGQYTITGMRVGGPYLVTISYVGYTTVEVGDIELLLGESRRIDAAMEPSLMIDAVFVTADDTQGLQHGSGSSFRADKIASMPTISRSIYDITRLSPLTGSPKAGGVTIAGASTRYNSFKIDGVVSDDVYGLGTTGMTGSLTQANPIPLDAIEQIRVSVAPFDVREGGFTGGGINAVTKAGDNTLRGSAYAYYNDQNFYGTTPGSDVAVREKLSSQTTQIYGVSLSGPVVRDKLFFFVNGEYNRNVIPSAYHPGEAGSAVTAEQARVIGDKYAELTGWNSGGYGRHDAPAMSGAFIARLDWNIDSTHHMSLRYNMLHADKNDTSNSSQYFYFTGAEYTNIN